MSKSNSQELLVSHGVKKQSVSLSRDRVRHFLAGRPGAQASHGCPGHDCGTELEAWSDMIRTPTLCQALGVLRSLLSIMTGLLRDGGPRQGLVLGKATALDSFGDMKHTRPAHAQGGQPYGSMKGGASASSNRASHSGTGIVS